MEQPAILGGKPVREGKILYGRQCIGDDVAAVAVEERPDCPWFHS